MLLLKFGLLLKLYQPLISLSNYVVLSIVFSIVIILFFEVTKEKKKVVATTNQPSKSNEQIEKINIIGKNKDTVFFHSPTDEAKTESMTNEKQLFEPKRYGIFQTNEIIEERQIVQSASGFQFEGELPDLDNLEDSDFDEIVFEDEIEENYFEKESLDILEIKRKYDNDEPLTEDEQTIIDTFFKTNDEWNSVAQISFSTADENQPISILETDSIEPRIEKRFGENNVSEGLNTQILVE
ncbi:hypothetical protein [Emticicia oligotrophica]|uniref:hypothetical protein n=1 Tax=Emticicia oligotrophica TaxID=312279 RepID=UPI00273AC3E0|nr:hypothetical protein [Emticicia oligotrophica]